MMSVSRSNIIVIAVMLLVIGGLGYQALRRQSDIVRRETLDATVKSLASMPQKPNALSFGTSQHMYMIELRPGEVGFVWDSVSRPHPIGATLRIERQTRANGTVTFAVAAQQ